MIQRRRMKIGGGRGGRGGGEGRRKEKILNIQDWYLRYNIQISSVYK